MGATTDKWIQFAVLLLQGAITGMGFGLLGPSLPDMKHLIGEEEAVDMLLLLQSLGAITLQVASNICIHLWSPYFLMSCSLTVNCVCFITLPMVRDTYTACAVVFVMSGSQEFGLCVQTHIALMQWPGNKRLLHFLYFGAAFGTFFSPLLISPFLSDGAVTLMIKTSRSEDPDDMFTNTNRTGCNNSTHRHVVLNGSNCTADFITLIQFPYFGFAALALLCTVGSVYCHMKLRIPSANQQYASFSENGKRVKPGLVYLTLSFILMSNSMGLQTILTSVLPSYGIDTLDLTSSEMAVMLSFHWSACICGRIVAVAVSGSVSQSWVLYVSMLGTLVTAVSLFLTTLGGQILLWVVILLIGLLSGPLLAAAMLWCSGFIELTTNVSSWHMFAISTGFVHSYACSFLMNHSGPMGFQLYLSILIFVVCMVVLILRLHSYRMEIISEIDRDNQRQRVLEE